jgi:metallo-beta-lactamase family protein
MAGSGMCTGGRIKHHLIQNISRPESTILFVGYQANGTLGRHITSGKQEVRIHGQSHKVRARIEQINGFSAHADRKALLKWLGFFKSDPKRIFLIHGEKAVAFHLAESIGKEMGFQTSIPKYKEEWELD